MTVKEAVLRKLYCLQTHSKVTRYCIFVDNVDYISYRTSILYCHSIYIDMAQRSILSMFKKTNVRDTICRPGKPTDTLSKSRTADPKSDVLGLEVAQGRTLQQIYCGGQLQHNAPVYSSQVCQQWQNLCSTIQ